ncbi:MAG: hypothetical protein ACE5DS_01010 [Kiloniellaceae bacterium]
MAGESNANLSVSFHGDQVTVEAESASLDRILDMVALQGGFAVERTGSRYRPPLITGHRTGSLKDILAWLLSTQNYVLFNEHIAGDGNTPRVRPSQLLLMNPPARRSTTPLNSAATIRFGGSASSVADRAPLDGTGARQGRMAAVQPVANISLVRGVPAPGNAGGAKDAEQLSASGNKLSDMVIDSSDVHIARTVDLAGDSLVATHVMAHKAAGPALQRTGQGTWVPWDGDEESLIDNGFTSANGSVTFEVVKGDLSDEFFPMTFTLVYRTESGLKFGSFQVMPDQRIPM